MNLFLNQFPITPQPSPQLAGLALIQRIIWGNISIIHTALHCKNCPAYSAPRIYVQKPNSSFTMIIVTTARAKLAIDNQYFVHGRAQLVKLLHMLHFER